MRENFSSDELKRIVNYDPETGIFIRKIQSGPNVKVGDVAGTLHKSGYINICILGKYYKAHRLAWLYMTGEWPKDQIDHIDGNPSNNKWKNLREADWYLNSTNRRKRSDNTSGITGVCFRKNSKTWRVRISVNKERKCIGYFKDFNAAVEARKEAEKEYGYLSMERE